MTAGDDGVELAHLRAAIALSESAVAHGNHPFGAVLADAAGNLVLEAENTVVTGRDVTAHAETNLVRMANRFSADELRGCTLYTSCEPCAMCSGAIYWAGIGRVVFGLAETELLAITGSNPANPTMSLPCRTVFAAGGRETIVVGPLLGAEARAPHRTFWG